MVSPTRQATVFVVEHDDAVRDALTTSLASAGFAAKAFHSAAHFVQGYRSTGRACLVIELELPEIEVLLGMLSSTTGDLPLIVTSRRLLVRRLPDELAGCVGLLQKPFGRDELMSLVRVALRLRLDGLNT
jgi:FixJ family two-component response regulator